MKIEALSWKRNEEELLTIVVKISWGFIRVIRVGVGKCGKDFECQSGESCCLGNFMCTEINVLAII